MSTKLLDLVNITKSYDGVTILDDLNLYIRENEFLTLLGPSGCGKTTTLRILGGFETPDAGKVLFNGQDITQLPPNKRQLNTVFQKYALFTHMTIAENIAFGLKIKRKQKTPDAEFKNCIRRFCVFSGSPPRRWHGGPGGRWARRGPWAGNSPGPGARACGAGPRR